MNIDDLTYGELKQIGALFAKTPARDDSAWQIGKHYLIRTVTMTQTGRLIAVGPQELVIEDAAWIADTGRFSAALEKLTFSEVEPFPDGPVIVGRGSVIDAVQIAPFKRVVK